jgi:hypothetical protein
MGSYIIKPQRQHTYLFVYADKLSPIKFSMIQEQTHARIMTFIDYPFLPKILYTLFPQLADQPMAVYFVEGIKNPQRMTECTPLPLFGAHVRFSDFNLVMREISNTIDRVVDSNNKDDLYLLKKDLRTYLAEINALDVISNKIKYDDDSMLPHYADIIKLMYDDWQIDIYRKYQRN